MKDQSTTGGFALRGIRVLDFTWIHAGPSATRILSDQGAQVIKVESDQALAVEDAGPPATARGLGQRHNWNSGKLSISMNMKTPDGASIAKRLVAVSDVVSKIFCGRVMPGWGMDYESIRQINPGIIMLSMSGFGRTGPWRDWVSYGQTLQAMSGFTELTGFPETDPCGPASAYSDAVAGMAGAQAVLLALLHRARTGQGQWINLSQFEAMSSLLGTLVLDLSANKSEARTARTGNLLPHGGGAPHGAYRCRGEDRWVAITVCTDDEWLAFVQALGQPAWAGDQRFSTAVSRWNHAGALDPLVESWTLQRSPAEVMELLQAAGIAAGVVQTGADLAEDPQLKHRGFLRQVLDQQGVPRTIESAPYKLSLTPGGVTRGSPEFGAHQTFVLRDILGMSDDELAECAIAGVFE